MERYILPLGMANRMRLCMRRRGMTPSSSSIVEEGGRHAGHRQRQPTEQTPPHLPVLNSEMAIFGPGGHVHVRSRTEKRPSSRPLLLSNRPLFAVYMPYLLSYCAGARSCPDPAVAAPLGPRLCGLCELRYGPWGVALLLLHLLLVLTGGKKNWLCATSTSTHAAAAAAAFFSLLLPLLRLSLLPCLLGGPAALVAASHVPTTLCFFLKGILC